MVELFENGKSLGKKYLKNQEDYIYKWAVTYKAGTLEAKDMKDNKSTSVLLETPDEPVAFNLSADRTKMSANNTDVIHVVA